MKINTAKHFFADALKSLYRNRTISTASIATVATTLFVLGIFLMTILNVNKGILQVQSKVELQVFLKNEITINEQRDLEKELNNSEGVVEVSYVSQAEALTKARELFSNKQDLMEGLEDDNPFPASFVVKVDKPERISSIADKVKTMEGVEGVRDARAIVEKIMTISRTIKIVGAVLFVILIGVSLFLIGNTIKLTVYSRRREIGIMKFIGATDWFIRWPFVFEGIIIGVLGAALAVLLLFYVYTFAYKSIPADFIGLALMDPSYILANTSWQFGLAGLAIGTIGSIMAIRKFLTV